LEKKERGQTGPPKGKLRFQDETNREKRGKSIPSASYLTSAGVVELAIEKASCLILGEIDCSNKLTLVRQSSGEPVTKKEKE